MEQPNNIQTVLDAGSAAAKPVFMDDNCIPFVTVPNSYEVKNLESLLPTPTRKRGKVTLTDSDSFISYAKRHGSLVDCVIYADIASDENRFDLIAVINDHGEDTADWRDFTATFSPKRSIEWTRWTGKNKAQMSQSDFATWLEDNLGDITSSLPNMPTGAQILDMALKFEANSDKKVRSVVNLQSGGIRFEFVDDETKETRTSMEAFNRFTLALPVFDGSSSAYPLEARLKYREKEGRVTFWYELIRPDRVFKTAVDEELQKIKQGTGFMLVSGKPW